MEEIPEGDSRSLQGQPPVPVVEIRAGKRKPTLAPLSTDFAYPQASSRSRSPVRTEPTSPVSRPRSLKSLASHRKAAHYRHHEAAPRKLIRKLNSLLHGNRSQRKGSGSLGIRSPFNGSAASLSRGNSATSAMSRNPFSAEPESIVPTPEIPLEDQRPFIKIRLATFNMHDTLPTTDGDFSDWLGDVSSCRPQPKKRKRSSMSSRNSTMTLPMEKELPKFPLDSRHPYHIIVVASQECPTASGVLAGRVRTLDGRGWTNLLENYLCGGSSYDSDSEHGSSDSDREGQGAKDRHEGEEAGGGAGDSTIQDTVPLGTSSQPFGSSTSREEDGFGSQTPSIHESNSGDSRRRRGPYVLVEKERLMGIYIAVFVARSCEDLVEGVSKSRVASGLIGGRVGNKGGAAVSLYFASSRLLFISAHLAAHASAIEIRKANVTKILHELDVDDFWESSGRLGPKPKNLTDRFDQTFFLGDLNFRLNVTRLHSDWLIARKEYATALRFDQLRDVLLEKPSVFPGFAEAPINFAPTYKYDVVHRVKKKRSTILGGRTRRGYRDAAAKVPFPGLDPGDVDPPGSVSDPEIVNGLEKPGDDDTLSIVSSVGTISTLDDFEQLERNDLDKGDLSSLGLPTPPKKGAETHMDAVRTAQVRFLTLVKTNSAAAALHYSRKRSSSTVPKSAPPLKTMFAAPRPILQTSQSALVVPMTRSTSAPLGLSETPVAEDDKEEEEGKRGAAGVLKTLKAKVESVVPPAEPVFDSSSKQRVQSYTDRILYKSTVEPPAEVEEEEEELDSEEEPNAIPLHPSKSSAFVSALRDFTHAPLTSNLRNRAAEGDADRPFGSRRGSAEDRHLRFSDVFTRPRRKSVSSDIDVGPSHRTSKNSMPRTKSLQPTQLKRQHSGATSVGTDESDPNPKKAFWRRVASFPALQSASASAPSSPKFPSTPSVISPSASPALQSATQSPTRLSPAALPGEPSYFSNVGSNSAAPTTPSTAVRRTPRKMFTISSDSPPSSPDEPRNSAAATNFASSSPPTDIPPLPRANSEQTVATPAKRSSSSNFGFPRNGPAAAPRPVRSVSGSALPSASTTPTSPRDSPLPIDSLPQVQTSTASLNTRFKSFLNSIPLPFLSAPTLGRTIDTTRGSTKGVRKKKYGPRSGEIKVLQYDSVPDLAKMGAVSDHRPVYGVFAIGVGEPVGAGTER